MSTNTRSLQASIDNALAALQEAESAISGIDFDDAGERIGIDEKTARWYEEVLERTEKVLAECRTLVAGEIYLTGEIDDCLRDLRDVSFEGGW